MAPCDVPELLRGCISRDASGFAIEVINGTLVPQCLEVMPDRSFQGVACQDSVFYRATLEQWDRDKSRWTFVLELSPLDTLKQNRISSGNADWAYLWPGQSVCVGWFPRSLVKDVSDGARFRVVLFKRFTAGWADPANRVVAIADISAAAAPH
jgi:hypothetical protein